VAAAEGKRVKVSPRRPMKTPVGTGRKGASCSREGKVRIKNQNCKSILPPKVGEKRKDSVKPGAGGSHFLAIDMKRLVLRGETISGTYEDESSRVKIVKVPKEKGGWKGTSV